MTPPAARRHLHSVPALQPAPAAQTFTVRLSAASGRASLLQGSRNLFGWFGTGTLRCDERGLEVRAPRRALLGFAARRRIHAHEVRGVYREGHFVQLEVRGGGYQGRLRFWAASSAAAAAIVELLPAQAAIELDTALRSEPAAPPRARSWWTPVLATLAALILFWFGVSRLLGPTPPPAEPPPAAAVPQPVAPAVPAGNSADVFAARTRLRVYATRFAALDEEFMTSFLALQLGNLSQKQFVDGLNQWLLPQWESLALQLRTASGTPGPAESRAEELLAATIDSERRALFLYARGLREQDVAQVQSAFRNLQEEETHEAAVRSLLHELERPPGSGERPTTR